MPDKVKKVVGLGLVIGASFFGGPAGAALAMKLVGASLIASGSKPKPTSSTTNGTELQLSGDPVDVRSICYGEAWTAGTLRYRNTSGTDNKDLYMVVVLAGHEIDSVQAVEADRQTLTLDGSGNVTSPSKWAGLMNVRFYNGTDSQSADSTLDTVFSNWTTDHRLRGLAYAVIKLTFNEESLNSVPAFRFKVRGRKVYDPRLDSTNGGSGSHRLATPSTWAWSRNPVLCANDFLRGVKVNSINIAGMGLATTRFDWANVTAEANVCEENVALAAGGNEDRYTCDGFIDPRQPMGEIVRHFEMSIAGDIIPSDGKWRFFAGAYRTPTLSLTDQHFIGPIRYNVHKGELERYDTAEGRYAALAESGTVVNYSPVRLSTATTGSERLLSVDFQLVADTADSGYDGGARAQRLAKLLLEKDAAGKRIQCRTNLYGLRCVPGETVQITHAAFGLTAQTMRVLEVQLVTIDVDGKIGLAVDLTLEAGPSSLYAWSAEESALSPAPSIPQSSVPPTQIGGMLVPDPFFNKRADIYPYDGFAHEGYYWASTTSFASAQIDIDGGSSADKGALQLAITNHSGGSSVAVVSLPTAINTVTRGEQLAFSTRLRRTSAVPAGAVSLTFVGGRGYEGGLLEEQGPSDQLPSFDNAGLSALTLNQWYDYSGVVQMGDTSVADSTPTANKAVIYVQLSTGASNGAMSIEIDSIVISRVASQQQIGQILQPITEAEVTASVTPTNYAYPPGDVRRYGAVGDGATDNRAAFINAVAATPVGGVLTIPFADDDYLVDTSGGESTAIEIDKRMTVVVEGVVEATYGAIQANPPTIFLVSADDVVFTGTGKIVGDGSTNSVNTGTDATFPSLVKVTGDNFTMDGLTIDTPYKVGVFLYSCYNGRVTRCNFIGGPTTYTDTAYFGVRLYQGGRHIISKNQFMPDVGGGMYVQCVFANGSSHNSIEGNVAYRPYEKIAYINGDYNSILNNVVVGNTGTIAGTNQRGTVGPAIRHDGVLGKVRGNLIYYCGAGISGIGGAGLDVSGNTLYQVGQSGVSIFSGSGVYDYISIRDNTIVNGAVPNVVINSGIYIEAPSGSNFYFDISHNQVVGFAPTDPIANVVAWTSSTAFAGISLVKPTTPNGRYYTGTGGTSGGSEPTWPTTNGATVSDGTITWTCVAYDATANAGVMVNAPGSGQLNERSIISFNNIAGGAQSCRVGIATNYMEQSLVSHNRMRCSVYGIQETNGQYNRYLNNSLDSGLGAAVAIQGLSSSSYGEGNIYDVTIPLIKQITMTAGVNAVTVSSSSLAVAPNAQVVVSPANAAAGAWVKDHGGVYTTVSSPNVILTSGDGTNFGGTEIFTVHVIQ